MRLDPARLPHRFATSGNAPAGRCEPIRLDVYIDRDHVIVKRRLAGLPLTLVQPMGTFLGVFAEVVPGAAPDTLSARIGLRHRDPALSIPLASGNTLEHVAEDWRAWGEALGLPLLLVEPDGSVSRVDAPARGMTGPLVPQRRRVAALTARRPRFLMRRKAGGSVESCPVHRGEREIIART